MSTYYLTIFVFLIGLAVSFLVAFLTYKKDKKEYSLLFSIIFIAYLVVGGNTVLENSKLKNAENVINNIYFKSGYVVLGIRSQNSDYRRIETNFCQEDTLVFLTKYGEESYQSNSEYTLCKTKDR